VRHVVSHSFGAVLEEFYEAIAADRRCRRTAGTLSFVEKPYRRFEAVDCPISSGGEQVDYIVGVLDLLESTGDHAVHCHECGWVDMAAADIKRIQSAEVLVRGRFARRSSLAKNCCFRRSGRAGLPIAEDSRKFPTVRRGRQPGSALEQLAEKRWILVSDLVADIVECG
jgi:hypothetical protein